DRVRTCSLDDLPPGSAGLFKVTAEGTYAKLEQGFRATLRIVGTLQSLVCGQLPFVKRNQRTWPSIHRRTPWLDGDTKPPGRRQIVKPQIGIAHAPLESRLQFVQGHFIVGESQPHASPRVMALPWQQLELPQPIGIGFI